jgi:iron-sulfur cluster assembly protein
MLTLTPNAAQTIEQILASPELPDDAGIRISPTGPAMDGASAGELAMTIAAEPDATDQVIEQDGARVFVQAAAAPYLDQMSLDANVVDEQVTFMLETPADGGA